MDEIEIVQKAKQGDMHAFELLFEGYKAKAMRTVYLMTGNPHTTEDIVQEAFTTCYLSLHTLKQPEYFKTWFFKLLTRLTWRTMKKEKGLIPTDTINEIMELADAKAKVDIMEAVQDRNEIYSQILKLDYKLQTTIILYYYNELTVKEIAKVMGCLEGTVKSRLYTARKQLKLHLIEEGKQHKSKEAYGI